MVAGGGGGGGGPGGGGGGGGGGDGGVGQATRAAATTIVRNPNLAKFIRPYLLELCGSVHSVVHDQVFLGEFRVEVVKYVLEPSLPYLSVVLSIGFLLNTGAETIMQR
jgi:hypothetical protein